MADRDLNFVEIVSKDTLRFEFSIWSVPWNSDNYTFFPFTFKQRLSYGMNHTDEELLDFRSSHVQLNQHNAFNM